MAAMKAAPLRLAMASSSVTVKCCSCCSVGSRAMLATSFRHAASALRRYDAALESELPHPATTRTHHRAVGMTIAREAKRMRRFCRSLPSELRLPCEGVERLPDRAHQMPSVRRRSRRLAPGNSVARVQPHSHRAPRFSISGRSPASSRRPSPSARFRSQCRAPRHRSCSRRRRGNARGQRAARRRRSPSWSAMTFDATLWTRPRHLRRHR